MQHFSPRSRQQHKQQHHEQQQQQQQQRRERYVGPPRPLRPGAGHTAGREHHRADNNIYGGVRWEALSVYGDVRREAWSGAYARICKRWLSPVPWFRCFEHGSLHRLKARKLSPSARNLSDNAIEHSCDLSRRSPRGLRKDEERRKTYRPAQTFQGV